MAFFASVPETQLRRVVRMVATAGFLQEPSDHHVAHTALSAPFVTHPGLLDAATFLSSTAAPAALKMSAATRLYPGSQRPDETAYNLAFHTSGTFAELCERQPRIQQQWPAYFQYGTDDEDLAVKDVLMRLDWKSLGNATVVDVSHGLVLEFLPTSYPLTSTLFYFAHLPLMKHVSFVEPNASG